MPQEKGQSREIITIMEELQDEMSLFREPTINEIALRAGIAPEIIKATLMTLTEQQKWKIQSQQQAESEARDAINLAGWLGWKEKGESNPRREGLYRLAVNSTSPEILKRANNTLKCYPDLVPTFWSESEQYSKQNECVTGKGIVVPFPDANLLAIVWPEQTKKSGSASLALNHKLSNTMNKVSRFSQPKLGSLLNY